MTSTLEDRVKLFEEEFKNLLEKYQLQWNVTPTFLVTGVMPPEIQMALIILDKSRVKYKLSYSEKK